MHINEVTEVDIGLLDARQLVLLLKKLLHLEADKHGLLRSISSVPLNINVADQGEDGRITWEGGPASTNRLPARYVMFQCKATKSMGPQECKAEIQEKDSKALKKAVAEVLDAKGAYVLFFKQACNQVMVDERETAIREGLDEAGRGDSETALIGIYDANKIADWTNQFPSIVTFVYECLGKSQPVALQTWGNWAEYEEFQKPYKPNEFLQTQLTNLRDTITQPKKAVRILGLSGTGKTRLAFEALRTKSSSDDVTQQMLSDSTLYYDAAFDEGRIADYATELAINNRRATLVVDNCSHSLHKRICLEMTKTTSCFSVLTLEANPEEHTGGGYPTITLDPKELADVVVEILKELYPGMQDAHRQRIADFAQGFPHIAVLLAGAWEQGSDNIGYIDDNEIVNRLIAGRDKPSSMCERRSSTTSCLRGWSTDFNCRSTS